MQYRLCPRLDLAISGQQFEVIAIPSSRFDETQPFWITPQKNVAADPVSGHQSRAALAHCIQPFQPELQPKRKFFGRRVDGRVRGKQQRRFQIRQPCRHHKIVCGQFQLQSARLVDENQILFNQSQNGYLPQVDLLIAREHQQ